MVHSEVKKVIGSPKCTVTAGEREVVEIKDKATVSFNVNYSFSDGSDTVVCRNKVVTRAETVMWPDSNEAANEYKVRQILERLHVPESHTLSLAYSVLSGIADVGARNQCWWNGFNATVNIDLLIHYVQ